MPLPPLLYTSRLGYNAYWQSSVGQRQLNVYALGVKVAGAMQPCARVKCRPNTRVEQSYQSTVFGSSCSSSSDGNYSTAQ